MNLADGDQRDFFVAFVAGDALGLGVQGRLAINEKLVMVMPVMQRDLDEPRTVGLPFHRKGGRVPIVEIPDQIDLSGRGCVADKIDRFGHFLGGITVEVSCCVRG